MTYLVGAKGQVVIAREIRQRLGIKPGWMALQRIVDDRVEIIFLPPEHDASLKGSLAAYLKATVPAGESWQKARLSAWESAIHTDTAEMES